ncbi:DUF2514 family protein [Pseudomonas fluorescens]|uniref:Protein of uncharacterized function (DUF2514) n=2 Tax=Pseudomonas fluorescens TaxID=294 RepID=A0A8B4I4J5_PSEFL|nr:DUF2514 family protein [Pseudomonas fluorescens]MCI4605401.1 DUF2514 domain-containing protein [Pseudomonas fluorescens]PQB00233.1 hypothetical protein B0A76_14395 [Pseudomonas fluorescens]RFP96708.1 DUF2514 domain-containing protein [Pseudomonas fluorescens]TWR48603.1 DUF2514 domain-containing protein [Pseudomonas fluorescens]UKJ70429.1 DUF2514 domain-containing protein [Pseudomonas fluorescens]
MTPVQKLAGLVLLALVLMAGTAVATWEVQDWRYGKQLAEIGESNALAVTEAGTKARTEEQRRQSAVNKEASDAREQNKAAAVDAGAADAAGNSLHIEAGKFAATACGDPGVAQRGASATRAAMVLSDLLQRADKRAGELAAAYDRARIAGLTCERSYQSVRAVVP